VVATALAACSTNPLDVKIVVNLATAQAQATATYDALQGFVQTAAAAAGPAGAVVTAAYADLGTLVADFAALPSGATTAATLAQSILSAVAKVMSLVPLPPATSTAISAGLAILSALMAGLSSITVVSPSSTSTVGATRVISAPVPIPLS
jgi:hypothetical protein